VAIKSARHTNKTGSFQRDEIILSPFGTGMEKEPDESLWAPHPYHSQVRACSLKAFSPQGMHR
jgi:hypothetical protein